MNRELFRFDEISIRGLCMDLLRNVWMILIAGISLWFLATGWHNLTYEPQYTSSATLVVTLKGESNTILPCLWPHRWRMYSARCSRAMYSGSGS